MTSASELTETDSVYNKSIQSYSRVAVPTKQFIQWLKTHGSAFLAILDKNDLEDIQDVASPSKKFKNM